MLIIINISWDENKYIVGTLALHGVVLWSHVNWLPVKINMGILSEFS
jgi:hypothetical protein